jgi:hypothetical protein
MADEIAPRKTNTVPWALIEPWAAPLVIAILVIAFYSLPAFSNNASVHWDAVDVQIPLQKYFADRMIAGHLPFWTPYLFSGYPLLANPELGAWYPPNWPFFLIRNFDWMELELLVNALIACLGAYYFFRRTVAPSVSAMVGALAYGLSGFFAGHSSHFTVFAAAACFPWLMWSYRRALDSRALPGIAIGGFAGGAMILAGHLPAAAFGFFGLAWYAVAEIRWDKPRWVRSASIAAAIVALSLAVSSIQLLPTLELIRHSVFTVDYSKIPLQPRSLMTLVLPDAIGTISMKDHGLITNHYLYGGMFLLALAIIGALHRRNALAAAAIGLPALLYALGPSALFYRLGALIPPLQSLGPPDIAWFLTAFALALLAATGSHRLFHRRPSLGVLCLAVFFADLWYWNLYKNPLAFARQPVSRTYNERVARNIAAPQLPLSRFDSRTPIAGVGPLLFPLDLKFETTTGYLMLKPAAYSEYTAAMQLNTRLRDGLNVGRYLSLSTGLIEANSTILPRAYFPHSVVGVDSESKSRQALTSLNPAEQSTVLVHDYALPQDPHAEPFVVGSDEQSYGVHYRAEVPSLLKLSVPWYPGWHANIANRPLTVLRVDHALMGVVVPPGDGLVEFTFRSTYFVRGLLVTSFSLLAMLLLAFWEALWKRLTMKFV